MRPLTLGLAVGLGLAIAGAGAAYFVLTPGTPGSATQAPVSSRSDELARQKDAASPTTRPGTSVALPPAQRSGSSLPAPIPQPVAEKFDNWRVRCVLNRDGHETCYAEQILRNDGGQPELALIYHPARQGKAARLEIKPPWGLMLQAGLTVSIDGGPALRVPIQYCLQSGCEASIEVSVQLAAVLGKATSVTIGMVSAEGKQLAGKLPLEGFADALKRLEQQATK